MPTFDCFFSTIQEYLPLNTNAQKANGDVFPIVVLDLDLYEDYNPVSQTEHEGQFSYMFTAWCPSRREYLVFEAAPFDPSRISVLSQAYYQPKEEKDEEPPAPLTLALTDVLFSCHSQTPNAKLEPQDDPQSGGRPRQGKHQAEGTTTTGGS